MLTTRLGRYFNKYALIHVALYGQSFFASARNVSRSFRQRGMTTVINDSLVSSLWTFSAIVVGGATSAFTFLFVRLFFRRRSYLGTDRNQYDMIQLRVANPTFILDESARNASIIYASFCRPFQFEICASMLILALFFPMSDAQAFIIGFVVSFTLGTGCISAGVSTLFVAIAEDVRLSPYARFASGATDDRSNIPYTASDTATERSKVTFLLERTLPRGCQRGDSLIASLFCAMDIHAGLSLFSLCILLIRQSPSQKLVSP